ncbi:hypothetical protein [Alkalicoccus chagannorensis]|uniref:hypothetical protein n=1 Tax=Alkalicoccus chagannorensis TaxID=427072 RepID=UPI000401793A|nr:hypothetical protein [Alkalicoccus chagannorensis]
MYELYVMPGCMHCRYAETLLQQHRAAFVIKNVYASSAYWEEWKHLAEDGMLPLLVRGDRKWSREEIEPWIEETDAGL